MSEQASTSDVADPATLTDRLTAEAASKSGVAWLRAPGGPGHAVWHVWREADAALGSQAVLYVVSGPGEQYLPELPASLEVIFRSKDTGGRLLVRSASARVLDPAGEEWATAAGLLRAERLNGVGDVEQRWRETCTIHEITPQGEPVESSASPTPDGGAVIVAPATGTTAGWRPWHLRGRAGARRNRRG